MPHQLDCVVSVIHNVKLKFYLWITNIHIANLNEGKKKGQEIKMSYQDQIVDFFPCHIAFNDSALLFFVSKRCSGHIH